jgi:hypothetical protein
MRVRTLLTGASLVSLSWLAGCPQLASDFRVVGATDASSADHTAGDAMGMDGETDAGDDGTGTTEGGGGDSGNGTEAGGSGDSGGPGESGGQSDSGVDSGGDSGSGPGDASGCSGDPNGTCVAATVLSTPQEGDPVTATGVLPAAGGADWFVVTFLGSADPQKTYHPSVVLSGDPGIVFDVYPTCSGVALGCGEGGQCVGKTTWEVFYTEGDSTGLAWEPIPPVGNAGQVYIKVYRSTGSSTCDPFSLSVTNAGCGALDTVSQCGGCAEPCASPGVSQTTASCTGPAEGLGATCSYTCAAGYLDCDSTSKPDTNGCECNAPGATLAQCCAAGIGTDCPIEHATGLGMSFYDCSPPCTPSSCTTTVAQDACTAFTGNAGECTAFTCPPVDGGASDLAWCATGSPTDCACWTYQGTNTGYVHDPHLPPGAGMVNCMCPSSASGDPTFN